MSGPYRRRFEPEGIVRSLRHPDTGEIQVEHVHIPCGNPVQYAARIIGSLLAPTLGGAVPGRHAPRVQSDTLMMPQRTRDRVVDAFLEVINEGTTRGIHREVARRLGISEATSKTYLSDARRRGKLGPGRQGKAAEAMSRVEQVAALLEIDVEDLKAAMLACCGADSRHVVKMGFRVGRHT